MEVQGTLQTRKIWEVSIAGIRKSRVFSNSFHHSSIVCPADLSKLKIGCAGCGLRYRNSISVCAFPGRDGSTEEGSDSNPSLIGVVSKRKERLSFEGRRFIWWCWWTTDDNVDDISWLLVIPRRVSLSVLPPRLPCRFLSSHLYFKSLYYWLFRQ